MAARPRLPPNRHTLPSCALLPARNTVFPAWAFFDTVLAACQIDIAQGLVMRKTCFALAVFVLVLLISVRSSTQSTAPALADVERHVDAILAQMTLEEKIDLLGAVVKWSRSRPGEEKCASAEPRP